MLLESIHGSRLYGLHHANSDYDYWRVFSNVPKNRARSITHKVKDGIDTTEMDLSTFSLYADRSSHQVLELVFSQKKTVCEIEDWCNSFVLNRVTFRDLYTRTISAFNHGRQRKQNEIKTVRHTLRLALNLQEGLRMGRFNPTLDPDTVEAILGSSVEQLETWRDRVLTRLD